MKQTTITLVAFVLACSVPVWAQDAPGIVVTRAASRSSRIAPAENFTGTARVRPLFDTTASTRAYGASVAFDAGARAAWHTHPRGQVLIVTQGVGRVQRWGVPAEEIRPGDMIASFLGDQLLRPNVVVLRAQRSPPARRTPQAPSGARRAHPCGVRAWRAGPYAGVRPPHGGVRRRG
jgi:mannose-6-phosphate isomerase-like protein (cupin superfamily)